MALIDWESGRYRLGNATMDATHAEFVALVNRLAAAEAVQFVALFQQLLEHTGDHFMREEALMVDSSFPALGEHRDEHRRVLAELRQLGSRVAAGRTALARRYVQEQLPDWFALHAATMDSALAAHLAHHPQPAALANP
jgi:hemerythrin